MGTMSRQSGQKPYARRDRDTGLAPSEGRQPNAMLVASQQGWGTTFRYALLLLVGRGMPLVGGGLLAYVAREIYK